MIRNSMVFDDKLWDIVASIDSLEKSLPVATLLKKFNISEDELNQVVNFLNNFNCGLMINVVGGEKILELPAVKTSLHMDLGLTEWIALQAHFPLMDQYSEKAFHHTLVRKMAELSKKYPKYDLFPVLEEEKRKQYVLNKLQDNDLSVVSFIEKALASKRPVVVRMREGKTLEVFPRKLVYLDGGLSLIAEDCNGRCLIYLKLSDIMAYNPESHNIYHPNFSSVEVSDFIWAVRSMIGKDVRMILRITNRDKVDMNPPFHFLGNPYITTNRNGEIIWAASVEASDELFEWLLDIREGIEIVDPQSLKKEFLGYCERKLEEHSGKILKKAS